jgi:membrane fusion protein (multidrug efflux system)
MASKVIYTAVAVAGIAVASGAAWWLQKPKAPGNAAEAFVAGRRAMAPARENQ